MSKSGTAETITFKKPRRVVSKAFDGERAVNALLLGRMGSQEVSRAMATAEGLLEFGMAQVDVHYVVGVPEKVVTALARKMVQIPRAGRRPTGMGRIFSTPVSHLRLSIFLGMIDQFVPKLVKGPSALGDGVERPKGTKDQSNRNDKRPADEVVNGEQLLAALRHTEMVCGPMSEDQVGIRYYLTAIHKLSEGEIFLKACGVCGVRHIRVKPKITESGTVSSVAECPYCQYLNWLGSRDGRRERLAGAGAKEARQKPSVEAGKTLDIGQAGFDALMAVPKSA